MDRTEAFRLSMAKGVGEGLGNGVILTWALIEMMIWFWVSLEHLRHGHKTSLPGICFYHFR